MKLSHVGARSIDKTKFIRNTKNTNQPAQSHKPLDVLHDYIHFNMDVSLTLNLNTYISSIKINILS